MYQQIYDLVQSAVGIFVAGIFGFVAHRAMPMIMNKIKSQKRTPKSFKQKIWL